MKRFLTSAAAAALLVAGTGSGAAAQTPLFELGAYGGLQWTSNWFEAGGDGEGYSIGPGPIFGLQGTFWTSPAFGVRLHGAYFPSGGPDADDDRVGEGGGDDYWLNNWLYDLDLVFRPGGSPLYFFLGGGGMTTNVAGDPQPDVVNCVPYVGRLGHCLSFEPSYASVGQGNVGLGFDFFPLGPFGLFGELAVHGYDSPTHETGAAGGDKFSFTPRAVLGLKLGFGDMEPEEVVVVPPPVVAPPPAPPAAPPAPPRNAIRVCVVQGTNLVDVEAFYRPTMGDTLVVVAGQDRPFSTVYPSTTGYAAGQTWFINNEPITFNNREYVKFGVARIITPAELTRAGEVSGVGVWRSNAAGATDDIIYVPTRTGCEFQGYQVRAALAPRG